MTGLSKRVDPTVWYVEAVTVCKKKMHRFMYSFFPSCTDLTFTWQTSHIAAGKPSFHLLPGVYAHVGRVYVAPYPPCFLRPGTLSCSAWMETHVPTSVRARKVPHAKEKTIWLIHSFKACCQSNFLSRPVIFQHKYPSFYSIDRSIEILWGRCCVFLVDLWRS